MSLSKIRLIVLFHFLCLGTYAQIWQAKTAFPGMHRDDACAFYLSNISCGFVGTGMNSGFQLTNDFWKYDTQLDTWSQIATLPGVVRQYACATQGNLPMVGCVFGGLGPGNVCLNDMWQYNYFSNTWQQLDSLPARGRMGADLFSNNQNYFYLIGGRDSTNYPLAETWRYDRGGNSWSPLATCPNAVWNAAGFYSSLGKIWFGTGLDSNASCRSEIYEYDIIQNQWTFHSTFPGGARQGGCGGITTSGSFLMGYLAFGKDSIGAYKNDLWLFDFLNWYQFSPSLPDIGRKGVAAFGNSCSNYFVCGIDSTNNRLNQNWNLECTLGIDENAELPVKINSITPSNFLLEFGKSIDGELNLIDITGKTVLLNKINNLKSYSLNLESLSQGLYLIHLRSEDGKERVLKVVRR